MHVERKQYSDNKTERKMREFDENEPVLVRDYRANKKWETGVITERKGPLTYTVTTPEGGEWKRHSDQIVPSSENFGDPEKNINSEEHVTDTQTTSDSAISPIKSPNTPVRRSGRVRNSVVKLEGSVMYD